jgi:hypothetical protein
MIEQYQLPQWIKDLIECAAPEDAQRIALHGYMLVTGIVERSVKTNTENGAVTVNYSFHNSIPLPEMKELVAAYVKAAWGADELFFLQSQKERSITTSDRMYFHVNFMAEHSRRKAKAVQAD